MPGDVTFGLPIADSTTNTTWKKLRSSSPFGKPPMTKEEIVAHGKCLCGQYIRSRLRRAGCLNRKVTQRLRILIDPGHTHATRDIFPTLNAMGEELERMHPRIYANVSRQLSRMPFGELADADAAPFLLHATAKELFKAANSAAVPAASGPSAHSSGATEPNHHSSPTASTGPAAPIISWSKIVSLFAVCGALAVDIVRQGHYDYLPRLLEGAADIIDEDLAAWIQQHPQYQQQQQPPHQHQAAVVSTTTNSLGAQLGSGCPSATAAAPVSSNGGGGGSWTGLVEHFRAPQVPAVSVTDVVCTNWLSAAMGGMVAVYVVAWSVRWLGTWCDWLLLVDGGAGAAGGGQQAEQLAAAAGSGAAI